MKPRIKVVESGGDSFAVSKNGWTMPLIEFYKYASDASRSVTFIVNPNYLKFWLDVRENQVSPN